MKKRKKNEVKCVEGKRKCMRTADKKRVLDISRILG